MDFVPDRRSSPRARYSGITFIGSGGQRFPCMAGDLSESGMLVFPQKQPRVASGHHLRLTFTLPELSSWIHLDGTLVRQTHYKRRTAWGIRFDNVPDEIRLRLRAYIFTSQPQSPVRAPPCTTSRAPMKPLSHRMAEPSDLEAQQEQTRRVIAMEMSRMAEADVVTRLTSESLTLSLMERSPKLPGNSRN
jgi:hypothetical protein